MRLGVGKGDSEKSSASSEGEGRRNPALAPARTEPSEGVMAQGRRRRLKKALAPYLMSAPYLLLIVTFPICMYNIIVQSLGYVPGVGGELSLDVLKSALAQERVPSGIGLSLYIALASTIPAVILGIVFAWAIVVLKQETVLGAIIAKLPQLIPQAVGCVIIVNMFLPSGLIARFFILIGFTNAADWFMQVLYFPNSIGVIMEYVWKESAFVAFMLLPSMSGISDSYGEAASNLGASTLRTFIDVTLPNCMPTVRTCVIIIFVITLGSYETPALLGSPIEKALPVMAYDYYGTSNLIANRPISMTLNLMMMVLGLGISLVYYCYGMRREKRLKGRF